ncbi:alcohol dehydrogenase [Brucella neotomae]|nr:alcohol dehydrogenase [Brucella neotomae]
MVALAQALKTCAWASVLPMLHTRSYADERILPADRLVKVPDTIDLKTAASMMLKGMTAQYLLRRTFRVEPARPFYSCGRRRRGPDCRTMGQAPWRTVIGTAGSEKKIALARKHGSIMSSIIAAKTSSNGCANSKWRGRGRCLRLGWPRYLYGLARRTETAGMFACFGQSSGVIPPFDLGILAQKGSLFATRPTLFNYIARRADLERRLLSFSMSWKAGRSRSRSTRPMLSRTPARPMKHWRHARRQARASCCHRWGR